MKKHDPLDAICAHWTASNKAAQVERLKDVAKHLPEWMECLIVEVCDYWLAGHAQERRKKETAERLMGAFFHIRMYRDHGFNVEQSAQMAARKLGADPGQLVRAWGDKAKDWKKLDPIARRLTKSERAKLWSDIMR